MSVMKLKDKTVLITGASSGIGEAAAHALIRRGARVILVARRREELERVAEELRHHPENRGRIDPEIFPADLTLPEAREALVHYVETSAGGLHVLINNAGIASHGRFDRTTPEVLRKTMEVNFFAMTELTRLLLPVLKMTPGERSILLVSTPSGLYGIPERFAYSASKAAGEMVMESLRMELKEDGIHTTVFCPGYTRTALRTSGLAQDGSTLKEEQARGARSPEEVAESLVRALEKRKRFAFTDTAGRVVYLLRSLSPGLLEWLIMKKTSR